jgi:hypothetical protein
MTLYDFVTGLEMELRLRAVPFDRGELEAWAADVWSLAPDDPDVIRPAGTDLLLVLSYTFTGTGQAVEEPVPLETKAMRFGGVRWWGRCPLVVEGRPCCRRVRKLYLPPGGRYFGCRRCYRLTYKSAQEHDKRVDFLRRHPDALAAIAFDPAGAPPGRLILALKALR